MGRRRGGENSVPFYSQIQGVERETMSEPWNLSSPSVPRCRRHAQDGMDRRPATSPASARVLAIRHLFLRPPSCRTPGAIRLCHTRAGIDGQPLSFQILSMRLHRGRRRQPLRPNGGTPRESPIPNMPAGPESRNGAEPARIHAVTELIYGQNGKKRN
jgi:hypothetical protein